MIFKGRFQPKPSYDLWQAVASEQEEVAVQVLVSTHALLDQEAPNMQWPPDLPEAALLLSCGRCCSYDIFLKGKGIFSLHGSLVTSTFKNKQRLQHSPARAV